MTDDEFQSYFYEVYDGIPEYAKKSIEEYLASGVSSEIMVSDELADRAQQAKGIAVPAAHLLSTDTNWHFVFRPFLRDAPKEKLRSIIQHEIIHAFLISVEFHPTEPAQSRVQEYLKRLESIRKKFHLKLPEGYDITEDLVCTINDDWGADDLAAKKWLQKELGIEDAAI